MSSILDLNPRAPRIPPASLEERGEGEGGSRFYFIVWFSCCYSEQKHDAQLIKIVSRHPLLVVAFHSYSTDHKEIQDEKGTTKNLGAFDVYCSTRSICRQLVARALHKRFLVSSQLRTYAYSVCGGQTTSYFHILILYVSCPQFVAAPTSSVSRRYVHSCSLCENAFVCSSPLRMATGN